MPNGHGSAPPLDVSDPGSLGVYLGWLGSVVVGTYETVSKLEARQREEDEATVFEAGQRAQRRKQWGWVKASFETLEKLARSTLVLAGAGATVTVVINFVK